MLHHDHISQDLHASFMLVSVVCVYVITSEPSQLMLAYRSSSILYYHANQLHLLYYIQWMKIY